MTSHPERDLAEEGEVEAIGTTTGGMEESGPLDVEPESGPDAFEQMDQAAQTILTDVAALSAERDEYLAALQRSQADFANYRKRVLRQQEELGARAASDLVGKLLPVLDIFDLAIAHLDPGVGTGVDERDQKRVDGTDQEAVGDRGPLELDALRQARNQLLDTLAKEGLERVDAVDVAFDPSVHEAVAHVEAPEGESPGPSVADVMRPGYRWRGQTLRAAMVRVRG
jgi:molecular chaperone GrpE